MRCPPPRDPFNLIPPLNSNGVPILSIGAEDAAAALGIGPRLLLEKSLSGELPSVRIGARRIYPVDALRQHLLKQG